MPIYIIKGGGTLTSYRVLTDTPTITADWATAGQVKFNAGSTIASFSVHKNGTNQTGVVAATPTLVTWSTEDFDIGGYFASSKWTPPAGKVRLNFTFRATGTMATSGYIAAYIYKNGALYKSTTGYEVFTTEGANSVNCIADANGTDYFEAAVFVDLTSGTATVSGDITHTYFQGHMI